MKIKVKLKGGPAHGDVGELQVGEEDVPMALHVAYCGGCKDWHWYTHESSKRGDELYVHDEARSTDRQLLYVHADEALDPAVLLEHSILLVA